MLMCSNSTDVLSDLIVPIFTYAYVAGIRTSETADPFMQLALGESIFVG